MLAVNTNTASAVTHNALTKTSRALNTALERLSTGQRINAAKDDPAGLAITSRMTSQVLALDAGIRAASDAVGFVDTIDGDGFGIGYDVPDMLCSVAPAIHSR